MSSGLDNLRNSAGRTSSVAPPPPGTTTESAPEAEPAPAAAAEAEPTPTRRTSDPAAGSRRRRRPASKDLPGKKVGELHYLRISLSATGRNHLKALDDGADNTSLGEQAIGALSRHAKIIKADAVESHQPDTEGLIPKRRRTKRLVGGGDKVPTTIGLTEEEAAAVLKLKEDTSYSYSLLFDLALTKDAETA